MQNKRFHKEYDVHSVLDSTIDTLPCIFAPFDFKELSGFLRTLIGGPWPRPTYKGGSPKHYEPLCAALEPEYTHVPGRYIYVFTPRVSRIARYMPRGE